MTWNPVMAIALHYFTEFGKPAFLTHTGNRVDLWRILCTSLLYFVLRVQCRRKVSSRLLSHLLMSFLLILLLSVLPVLLLSVMQCWCLWYRWTLQPVRSGVPRRMLESMNVRRPLQPNLPRSMPQMLRFVTMKRYDVNYTTQYWSWR